MPLPAHVRSRKFSLSWFRQRRTPWLPAAAAHIIAYRPRRAWTLRSGSCPFGSWGHLPLAHRGHWDPSSQCQLIGGDISLLEYRAQDPVASTSAHMAFRFSAAPGSLAREATTVQASTSGRLPAASLFIRPCAPRSWRQQHTSSRLLRAQPPQHPDWPVSPELHPELREEDVLELESFLQVFKARRQQQGLWACWRRKGPFSSHQFMSLNNK